MHLAPAAFCRSLLQDLVTCTSHAGPRQEEVTVKGRHRLVSNSDALGMLIGGHGVREDQRLPNSGSRLRHSAGTTGSASSRNSLDLYLEGSAPLAGFPPLNANDNLLLIALVAAGFCSSVVQLTESPDRRALCSLGIISLILPTDGFSECTGSCPSRFSAHVLVSLRALLSA